jgi:hypothetical protein
MIEKVMQKTLKIIKNEAQKGANNHQKSIKNEVQKSDDFRKRICPKARGDLGPRRHSFQKTFEDKLN